MIEDMRRSSPFSSAPATQQTDLWDTPPSSSGSHHGLGSVALTAVASRLSRTCTGRRATQNVQHTKYSRATYLPSRARSFLACRCAWWSLRMQAVDQCRCMLGCPRVPLGAPCRVCVLLWCRPRLRFAPPVESRNRYGQGLLLFFMNSFVLF